MARKGAFSDARRMVSTANDLRSYLLAGVLQNGALAVDAVPEKFKTTQTLYWRRGGIQFSKAAATAIVFSAAHPVAASKYGAVLVQISDTGAITTKISGATQTTSQAYATSAAAIAALPEADAGNVAIGYIVIANNAGTWTANTDDLTDGSDLTTATFVDATAASIPAAL